MFMQNVPILKYWQKIQNMLQYFMAKIIQV